MRGRRSPSFKNVLVARELVEVVVTSQREYLFLYGFLLTLATQTFFYHFHDLYQLSHFTNYSTTSTTTHFISAAFNVCVFSVIVLFFLELLPSIPLLGNVFRNHFGNDA